MAVHQQNYKIFTFPIVSKMKRGNNTSLTSSQFTASGKWCMAIEAPIGYIEAGAP
jgi:hypothetical protein